MSEGFTREVSTTCNQCTMYQSVGRALKSDWSENSLITVVYDNVFLFVIWTEKSLIIKLFSDQLKLSAPPVGCVRQLHTASLRHLNLRNEYSFNSIQFRF